jgi:hypothetical protein
LPADDKAVFAPVVVSPAPVSVPPPRSAGAKIEIEVAGAFIRVSSGVDLRFLSDVVRAVRALHDPDSGKNKDADRHQTGLFPQRGGQSCCRSEGSPASGSLFEHSHRVSSQANGFGESFTVGVLNRVHSNGRL